MIRSSLNASQLRARRNNNASPGFTLKLIYSEHKPELLAFQALNKQKKYEDAKTACWKHVRDLFMQERRSILVAQRAAIGGPAGPMVDSDTDAEEMVEADTPPPKFTTSVETKGIKVIARALKDCNKKAHAEGKFSWSSTFLASVFIPGTAEMQNIKSIEFTLRESVGYSYDIGFLWDAVRRMDGSWYVFIPT